MADTIDCIISVPKPQIPEYDPSDPWRLEFVFVGETVNRKLYSVISLANSEALLIAALDLTGLNYTLHHSQDLQGRVKTQGSKAHAIDYIPDVVTYDSNGDETSRRRPTLAEVVVGTFAGHEPMELTP